MSAHVAASPVAEVNHPCGALEVGEVQPIVAVARHLGGVAPIIVCLAVGIYIFLKSIVFAISPFNSPLFLKYSLHK